MHIVHQITHHIDTRLVNSFITLDYEGRYLRRKRLETDEGEPFFVELPETKFVSDTDGFVLDDGRIIGIRSKQERLAKITHPELPLIAWHIGNRHAPCQIESDFLLIQEDHVLEEMLKTLGATVESIEAPFFPEGGAYSHRQQQSQESSSKHQT